MKLFVILALVFLAALSSAYPVQDSVASAGHHQEHGHGRVQIKVYRGQSKPHGHGHYGHENYFAPYGYWVRQPPDNHGHGYH